MQKNFKNLTTWEIDQMHGLLGQVHAAQGEPKQQADQHRANGQGEEQMSAKQAKDSAAEICEEIGIKKREKVGIKNVKMLASKNVKRLASKLALKT